MKEETLPEVSGSLPIIRLADIEKNPDLIRTPPDMQLGYDQNNHYIYMYSFLAPSQYEIKETGIIKTEESETENNTVDDEQNTSLYLEMYRLRFSGMNQWFLTGYLYMYSDWIMPLTEVSNQRYDKIMVDQGDETKRIIAIKGAYFIDLIYTGNADLDTVLEAAADKLESFENSG